jgi:RNA polymerase sigma-70 factor (ECF subfamily)
MLPKTLSDTELIEGLRSNSSNKQYYEDALYGRFAYFIEQAESKFRLTHEDAFSAYSDAVIKALEHITNGRFEGKSSLKTYLYQIFNNKCVDQVRKNTTKKSEVHQATTVNEKLNTISDTAKTVIQRLTEQADIDLLRRKLLEIGDNCRQLLQLSAEGYSDKEIATILKFKTAAVSKTSRLRCLDKLRKLYKTKQ